MILYRVDIRQFNVGDIIYPRSETFLKSDELNLEDRQIVEQKFEEFRPQDKPQRTSILMLFESLERAKRHWSISTNAFLYEVEIGKAQILHVGDYEKVEKLFEEIRKSGETSMIQEITLEYWNEDNITEPEFFVNCAVVSNVLGTERDRINYLKQRAGIKPLGRSDY